LHARDPIWVPPLRFDVATTLNKAKNPYFEHAEAEYFLAERDGEVVGRIAATHNRLHNETHGDRVGFWGWFECIDDQAVANALFDAADAWLRARGLIVSRGPASFSTNDQCGLLVDGFETRPTLMMPHNPRYYPVLVEGAGYAKAKDLFCLQGGDQEKYKPVPERASRGAKIVKERLGLTVRPLNMKDFKGEVARIKAIYNASWEKNWGFVPLTDHEIDHLADQFKPIAIPDMVPFVEKDGKVIGFGLTLPDLNAALIGNRKGRLIPFILKTLYMLKTRKLKRARILLLGVLPEWRGRGVDAVLFYEIWEQSARHGIYWGEGGWVLEDNPAMWVGLEKMGFEIYKTYRMYDRPL
jgi:GNAT superfamily N-acetyltransferase